MRQQVSKPARHATTSAVRQRLTVRQYVDDVIHTAQKNVRAVNTATTTRNPSQQRPLSTVPLLSPREANTNNTETTTTAQLWQQWLATLLAACNKISECMCAFLAACAKWLSHGSPLSFAPLHAPQHAPQHTLPSSPTPTTAVMRPPQSHRGRAPKLKGDAYERQVWTALQGIVFVHPTRGEHVACNVQRNPAGSSAKKDIVLNYVDNDGNRCTTGMEVKTSWDGVDWVQSKMRFVEDTCESSQARAFTYGDEQRWGRWVASEGCKCSYAGNIFAEVLNTNADKVTLAPLVKTKLTLNEYDEWKAHKTTCKHRAETDATFIDPTKDVSLPLGNEANCHGNHFAADAYRHKGCAYVQIKGWGMYHTGEDVCGFGVPLLEFPTKLRFRVKSHGRNKHKTHYGLSNMATARATRKPCTRSPFSLDDITRFPPQLRTRVAVGDE